MPQIQQLPAHIADLIAAGEVVERPASVCKELLENALDAGASAVSVELEHGGMTYLRVTDNGCGIAPEQLPTAFLRHATSKLHRAEDLAAIGTLGFRGEALAAISAVSRVDIFSRQRETDSGASLHLEGGVPGEVTAAGCPVGTTVCVRDLFYNTPARRKFLKTDRAEGAACAAAALRCALGRPDVSVRCIRDGEELFFSYAAETGAKVLVYRFPNLFGKWCRPNYNSAVATFCHNYAHDLPITVNDPSVELELLYIDDLVDEMIAALEGREHHCEFEGVDAVLTASGRYCAAPVTHRATLGQIVALLDSFKAQPQTLLMPEIPAGSFAKKLYSTYLSYLPREKAAFPLKMNVDARGSFTELLKTANCGQFSVNISRPGVTKGQHWHNTKWEFFIVVSGHGLIQQRKVGTGEVLNFEVSGEKIEAVHMLPGYTHNIINLSETEDLVTLMWANECFDPKKPDTFFEVV